LSESVKQNFYDLREIKSETERIQKILDVLYAKFLKKNAQEATEFQTNSPNIKSNKQKKILLYSLIAVTIVIGSVIGVILAVFFSDNQNNTSPSLIVPQNPAPITDDPIERQAMIDLFMATNGSGWNSKQNWMTNTSICVWQGIMCNGNKRIISLRFMDNNLIGTFPNSIAKLEEIITFRVSNNPQLTGTLPEEIYYWRKLMRFDVSENQLIGQLPRMSSLELIELNVSRNRFDGTIPVIKSTEFQEFALDNNNLVGSVFNLKDLQSAFKFRIDNNRLSGVLTLSNSMMISVSHFNVSHNNFTLTSKNLPAPTFALAGNRCDVSFNNFYCPAPQWMQECGGNCYQLATSP